MKKLIALLLLSALPVLAQPLITVRQLVPLSNWVGSVNTLLTNYMATNVSSGGASGAGITNYINTLVGTTNSFLRWSDGTSITNAINGRMSYADGTVISNSFAAADAAVIALLGTTNQYVLINDGHAHNLSVSNSFSLTNDVGSTTMQFRHTQTNASSTRRFSFGDNSGVGLTWREIYDTNHYGIYMNSGSTAVIELRRNVSGTGLSIVRVPQTNELWQTIGSAQTNKADVALQGTNLFLGTRSVITNNDATTNVFIGPLTRGGGVTIGPGGNVGIGTATPTAVTTISNTTATTPSLQVFGSNNPIANLTVASNGFVAVNKAHATVPLDVAGQITGSSIIAAAGNIQSGQNFWATTDSGKIAFGSGADAWVVRHGVGTNGFANASAVSGTGSALASNLVLRGVLSIPTTRAGNATLVGGTVTVANTSVTANTLVMLSRKTAGGTLGTGGYAYTVSAGTSFTINSIDTFGVLSTLDTSAVSYFLIENP